MQKRPFRWPPDKAAVRTRAIRLEWVTIGALLSSALALFLVSGASQAVRSAFIEDLISIAPAVAFLVAVRIERKPPSRRFPFGTFRAVSIAYLVGAVATLLLGVFLFVENVIALFAAERPVIGNVVVFGTAISEAWLMLAAILYSTIPAVILGRLKLPLARAIHDKVLVADASMQKADWMTGVAALLGVGGILIGWWWVDSGAAIVIAVAILHDGFTHVGRSIRDLADERPTTIEGHLPDPIVGKVRKAVLALEFVDTADVRFREDGRLVTGVIHITAPAGAGLPDDFARIVRDTAEHVDWRVHDPDVVLIASVPERPAGKLQTTVQAPRSRRRSATTRSSS
ncbi:MAG: cation transporter [Bauldia sp.]|nr:cation transporter [Bauldia sp.]